LNRAQLQHLVQLRIDDARSLLAAGRWAAAYYLTGYAVECALKSCVLRYLDDTGMIFRDAGYLKSLAGCWTHDLVRLVQLAGLEADFGRACGANPALNRSWSVTKDWEETSRYVDRSEVNARELFEAVTHDPNGVLKWIQTRW
jgi:hypothetical protein